MSASFNSKILARMWERVEQSKQDSDVAYFHDLMLLGEFLVKLLTSAILASVESDRDRQRYKVEYQLVRADGIGEWSRALEEVISGPANSHIFPEARSLVREITENFLTGEPSWQRVAIDNLSAACQEIDSELEQAARKTNLQWWVRNFATLRNRTRGHGAITIRKCSTAVPLLEASILSLMTGCAVFSVPWIYLHRNISGKYRLSVISGDPSDFSYLKSEKDHVYVDGIHIAFNERLARLPLIHSDVDINDFYMANGGYKEGKGAPDRPTKRFHMSRTSEGVKALKRIRHLPIRYHPARRKGALTSTSKGIHSPTFPLSEGLHQETGLGVRGLLPPSGR
ncbi:hypothetical protein ACQ86D_26005 [Streptomyces galilaeus]